MEKRETNLWLFSLLPRVAVQVGKAQIGQNMASKGSSNSRDTTPGWKDVHPERVPEICREVLQNLGWVPLYACTKWNYPKSGKNHIEGWNNVCANQPERRDTVIVGSPGQVLRRVSPQQWGWTSSTHKATPDMLSQSLRANTERIQLLQKTACKNKIQCYIKECNKTQHLTT